MKRIGRVRSSRAQTAYQTLGELGETAVVKHCSCPRCKRPRTLRRLPRNFEAADIICKFCAFTAQVKATSVRKPGGLRRLLPGASWRVQQARMKAHIYLPLYIVTMLNDIPQRILYLPPDFQTQEMFRPRTPLSQRARRAGWQGFYYDLRVLPEGHLAVLWARRRRALAGDRQNPRAE